MDVGIMLKSMAWTTERDRRQRDGLTMPSSAGMSQQSLEQMLKDAKS